MKSLTPNIKVKSIARSLSFYRDLLGFETIMKNPENDPVWVMMGNGNAAIMLQQEESIDGEYPALKGKSGGALTFFIQVEDPGSLYERVKDGAAVVKELAVSPYGKREFAIQDPDGFILTFAGDI